ncbi:uncharacterized protein PV09_04833 [Verruconis gallopava]|uniref:BTB domain-containing protein n=1 Tax=Verruconis gallopava TaxID=253628 RepID=A0A0D1YTQ6_9PEZI|nr:uncharacterized protein PV09_04833 [Verruconis gallopava]KIW04007.1 hypothetical protein PV09_04833 [Verruconis gallopava]
MVSYPEDSSTHTSVSSGLRSYRSPSVASSSRAPMSSTVRRHHRHARSHAGGGGGGSLQLQNEFPLFLQTGDVEIIIKNSKREQRYVLHRLILAQCSGFFETGTSDEWSQVGLGGVQTTSTATVASSGTLHQDSNNSVFSGSRSSTEGRRWRYELDWEGGTAEDVPMLVKKPATTSSFTNDYASRPPPMRAKPPPSSSNGFFRSMANFTSLNLAQHAHQTSDDPDEEIFQAYDNMFRTFYNYPPMLDAVQISEAYGQCKQLLQLADMYDALDVIGPRVDHHLLRFQGRLWKQIAKYPPSYLKLGYLAKSRAIFQEALIHVVGQWPAGQHQLRNHVSDAVIEMIEDKVDELDEIKARVEAKLWRLTLTTSRGERVTPHNAWLDWQVMSLWRQWFAENTTPQPTPILKPPSSSSGTSTSQYQHRGSLRDTRSSSAARASSQSTAVVPLRSPATPPTINTGRIFRLIGTGGSSYLPHDELKRFLKISPELYSRESLRRAERRLDELKNLAKDAVKPLMRNFLELDLRDGALPYLVCTRMEDRDWRLVFGDD